MLDEPTISTADLAAEVGVSRQMIGKWMREGLSEAAKVSRGKWRRESALSWIADRREDSVRFDGEGSASSDITEARIDLYRAQTKGANIRNDLALATMVYRDRSVDAFSRAASEQIASGDAWARDHRTPACAPIAKLASAAAIIAIKAELWNELRGIQSESVKRVAGALAAGEDVAPSRIRLSRRVG